jgi:guanylate kinase
MQGLKRKKGILFVISGPSGVGKNSVLASLLKEDLELCYSISATTRAPRKGEADGVNYFFLSREDFLKRAGEGQFFEYQEYVGNLYGTPKAYIEKMVEEGKDVVLDIECRGAAEIKRQMPGAVTIFLTPPSFEELKSRLIARSTDSMDVIEMRIRKAEQEMKEIYSYDYYVINDYLQKAVGLVRNIIGAERLKVSRLEKPSE